MALRWWQWRNIQEKLRLYGRVLQGTMPYRIEFADEPNLTGLTDFSRQLVRVNPEMIPGLRARQAYDITKAVLCHEAGHRRFTTPTTLPPVVHMVSNILEDQRIESLMMEEFAGTRTLIRALTERLFELSPNLEAGDDPRQVVAAALQYRWAYRLGESLKGELSAVNQERWEKVRPLVEAAWVASSSLEVDRFAERIVEILDLKEHHIPLWVIEELDRCEGDRGRGDHAERHTPVAPEPFAGDGEPHPHIEAFDGELVPNGHRAGDGRFSVDPKPYIELEERATPLAQELIEELSLAEIRDELEPVAVGGRLSVRQYLREREQPFLALSDEPTKPPTIALRVVIDHSTSMNYGGGGRMRIESVAEGAMMLHLACEVLGIEHQVAVTPQQIVLADNDSGERGKALIAGMVPAKTGWEDIAVAIRRHGDALLQSVASVRLIVVLHDGYPNDGEDAKRLCLTLRGKVEVIGILLDPDDATKQAMAEIFGHDRLIACESKELPKKLAAMLRSIRGI